MTTRVRVVSGAVRLPRCAVAVLGVEDRGDVVACTYDPEGVDSPPSCVVVMSAAVWDGWPGSGSSRVANRPPDKLLKGEPFGLSIVAQDDCYTCSRSGEERCPLHSPVVDCAACRGDGVCRTCLGSGDVVSSSLVREREEANALRALLAEVDAVADAAARTGASLKLGELAAAYRRARDGSH